MRESKRFHLISGRFQTTFKWFEKKPKPKHCASTEQVVSASEFYDFRPCKPWAWRIVFTKRNLVCIRFNSSKRETNKNTKNNSASMNISIDCRHCMYYYYCDGRCKDVITLNLSTWHNIFASFFSTWEYKSRAECFIATHFWLTKQISPQFEKSLNMPTICCTQHMNAIAAAYRVASHLLPLLHHYLWCNFPFICICTWTNVHCASAAAVIYNLAALANLIWKQSSQPRY